jgi:hypothetical protein
LHYILRVQTKKCFIPKGHVIILNTYLQYHFGHLLHQEHFLSAVDQASVTGTQETKQNSPKLTSDQAGCLVEDASTSKEEMVEVTNVSESQTQAAANGESRLLLWLVTYSVVRN